MANNVLSAKNGHALNEVLKPLLYADVFDYPLTGDEIYRFLEQKMAREVFQEILDQALFNREVVLVDGFYSLADRNNLAARRKERQQVSRSLWRQAEVYGRWMASLPFVRMVAVTGSLAVENPRDGIEDIDYLVVTRPGRLWLCRALISLMVRYGRLRHVLLCPNYLVTENELLFDDQNLFAAREMLQMVPLYGHGVYQNLRAVNTWVTSYLPQGTTLNLGRLDDRLSPGQARLKAVGERLLSGRGGHLLEKLLQKIQIPRHQRRAGQFQTTDTVIFSADQCKGHTDGHGHRIMAAYWQRMEDRGCE